MADVQTDFAALVAERDELQHKCDELYHDNRSLIAEAAAANIKLKAIEQERLEVRARDDRLMQMQCAAERSLKRYWDAESELARHPWRCAWRLIRRAIKR